MTTRKFLFRGPAESNEYFRVRVLLYRLWVSDLLPGSGEDLDRLLGTLASDDAYVGATLEVTPEVRRLVAAWAQEYLQSDNQHLVPLILEALIEQAPLLGDIVYRASARFERRARDPLALPRPSSDVGRERYAAALARHHEAGHITIDGWRAWEHAEAWIKVRHKLVESLAKLVRETKARPYTMSDGEDSYGGEYDGRYKRTWKNLKAIDKAIKAIVLPLPSPGN